MFYSNFGTVKNYHKIPEYNLNQVESDQTDSVLPEKRDLQPKPLVYLQHIVSPKSPPNEYLYKLMYCEVDKIGMNCSVINQKKTSYKIYCSENLYTFQNPLAELK